MSSFDIQSCGFIIFRCCPETQTEQFLLMKHPNRWDLPKGHVDPGESEMECALRELDEETGIKPDDLEIDSSFRFTQNYTVKYKRTGYKPQKKELVIFLARLNKDVPINLTEHEGFRWFQWSPPHAIQEQTIDPLLAELETHFSSDDQMT